MSAASASDTPVKALRRKIRHQPSMRFNQAAQSGDEGVLNSRVRSQPVPNQGTAEAREVVRDEVEVTLGIGLVQRLEQSQVALVLRGRRLGERLPIVHAQCTVEPMPSWGRAHNPRVP